MQFKFNLNKSTPLFSATEIHRIMLWIKHVFIFNNSAPWLKLYSFLLIKPGQMIVIVNFQLWQPCVILWLSDRFGCCTPNKVTSWSVHLIGRCKWLTWDVTDDETVTIRTISYHFKLFFRNIPLNCKKEYMNLKEYSFSHVNNDTI